MGTVGPVVEILDRRHRYQLLRFGHLHLRHLGQPDLGDLALRAEVGQRADLILERHFRIDAVQVEQLDTVRYLAQRYGSSFHAALRRYPPRPTP